MSKNFNYRTGLKYGKVRETRESKRPKSFFQEFQKQDDEKTIQSTFHTLVTEENPEEYFPLEEDGEYNGTFGKMPSFRVFKLFTGDFGEEENGLHKIYNKLNDNITNFDILELHIDSNGGSVNEGKLFYNIINNFEPDAVYAYLNVGYSMGALLFCMPETRIAHEMSDLMFHDYSSFLYGKGGDQDTYHKHTSKHMREFFKAFTVDKGFLSEEEFELMMVGKEYWMDTKEMVERGIATHVKTIDGIIKADEWYEKKFNTSKEPTQSTKKPRAPKQPKVTKED